MMKQVFIFVLLFYNVHTINFTSSMTSSTSTTTTSCKCMNNTQSELNVKKINASLRFQVEQRYSFQDIDNLRHEIVGISTAVQNNCGCVVSENRLYRLVNETREKFDFIFLKMNSNHSCEYLNGTEMESKLTEILQDTDRLRNKTEPIRYELDRKIKKRGLIMDNLNHVINETSDKVNSTSKHIEEVKEEIIDKLDDILDNQANGVSESKCKCEAQLNIQTSILSKKQDFVLKKLNQSKDGEKEERGVTKHDIKVICEKLDIISKGDKKEIPSWKIPDHELECLPFGDCLEKAACHLDDFYKNMAWRRMPQVVKECLIVVYCKMGWIEMKRLTTFRKRLESGSWTRAADALRNTDWAVFWDPAGAREIIFKLKTVTQPMDIFR